jgi:Domain of unknown function (DUF5658)
MTFRSLVMTLVFVAASQSSVFAESAGPIDRNPTAEVSGQNATAEVSGERPALLTGMYLTLGAIQTWDLLSTSAALKRGARETNPIVAGFAGQDARLIALKAVSTVGTILFAERLRRRNETAAIVVVAMINSALAAVAMRNLRNAKFARVR